MNGYHLPVEAELDLHGYTVDEARLEVEDFLCECRAEGLGKVRVITGKGLHSENQTGVLRAYVKRMLDAQDLRYEYAKYNEGGEGALDVYLF